MDRYFGNPRRVTILMVLLTLGGLDRLQAEDVRSDRDPRPELVRLRAHVDFLASPELAGRRGPGAVKAAEYIAEGFRKAGLEPLFDGGFFQEIPDREPGQVQGRNVGAKLVGSDPKLRDEWIIVSAHYDHLGTRGGVIYPGADDNASGVAMLLETARCFAEREARPRRSVMFVSFDLEEVGLFGSRYFAEHPPAPLDAIALFVTADMIGRALGGVCTDQVFAIGSEHSPAVQPWIESAAEGEPVTVGTVGADLLLIDRSDYGPFRARKVPFLFFSTGESPLYHTPEDKPETLDYPKLQAISRVIEKLARRASDSESRPRWTDIPEHPRGEARALRSVMETLLANKEQLAIGGYQVFLMRNTLRTLETAIARGSFTPGERTAVLRVARLVLFTVL